MITIKGEAIGGVFLDPISDNICDFLVTEESDGHSITLMGQKLQCINCGLDFFMTYNVGVYIYFYKCAYTCVEYKLKDLIR